MGYHLYHQIFLIHLFESCLYWYPIDFLNPHKKKGWSLAEYVKKRAFSNGSREKSGVLTWSPTELQLTFTLCKHLATQDLKRIAYFTLRKKCTFTSCTGDVYIEKKLCTTFTCQFVALFVTNVFSNWIRNICPSLERKEGVVESDWLL